MLRYGFEIYQQLIKMFVRTNKRFPNPQENKFLQNQALRVREGLFDRGVNMEELSAEDAIKVFSKPPRRRKPPTAEIYKPLEFGKKTKPKEGLEALDEAKVFDQFRDENTLQNLYRTREEAIAKGDNKTALKISEDIFAIENKKPLGDGYKAGGMVRFIKRILSADDVKKIAKKEGIPEQDVVKFLSGEYGILKRGQGRGTIKRNRKGIMSTVDKQSEKYDDPKMFDDIFNKMFGEYEYEMYKKSGRKPMKAGGIAKAKKILDLLRKTESQLGKAPKTDISKVRARVSADKKSIEDLAKSEQIPVRNDTVKEDLNRQLTDDEIYDLDAEVGDLDAYDFDGTVGSANRIRKEYKEYMDYMYGQYKAGKLDPSPGEVSRSRMKYLQDKQQEAEMTDDFRLFTPDEADELSNLEQRFEYLDLTEKAQDISKPLSNDDIQKLKEFDDMGFGDVLKALDRTKKRDGGLATLFMER